MQTTSQSPKSAEDPRASARDDAHAALSDLSAHGGAAAQDIRDTAVQVADNVKSQGSKILEAARERADGLATEGKDVGSKQISGFATAIRNAAKDIEDTSPEIAGHVRAAAGSIEEISTAVRDRSVGELLQDVTRLARRQPAAFFGVAAIAGFAIARFAKSSGDGGATASSRAPHSAPDPSRAPGWVQATDDKVARPATMAAATLGGAAAHRSGHAAPGSMPTGSSEKLHVPRDVSAKPGSPGHADPVPNERSGSQL